MMVHGRKHGLNKTNPAGRRWQAPTPPGRLTARLVMAAALLLVLNPCGCSSHQTEPAPEPAPAGKEGPASAVIVDQLSISYPNPEFATRATGILQQGGYVVDYVPGEEVTVEFFRRLPLQNHEIIVLRAHSSTMALDQDGNVTHEDFTSISTGEPASDKYSEERNTDRLGGFLIEEDDQVRFTIRPGFIDYDMIGDFDGAVIIMMGCDGMRVLGTAQSLLDKGAGAVAGWNGEVSVEHTDKATEFLLQQLVIEKRPIADAVSETRLAIGADPVYQVTLALWSQTR